MNIVFIQDNALDESQALIELAAFLTARGHRCDLLLDREERDLAQAARALSPDLVIIAASMLNHGWARSAAERLYPLGVCVALGGTAPTLFPQALLGVRAHVIVRGEAEGPIGALVEALEAGARPDEVEAPGLFREVDGAWAGTPPAPGVAMDTMPLATKDLYYARYPFMRQFPFKRFLASRGCHHRCSYCYIAGLNTVQPREKGSRWTRRKSPEAAVEEVAREQARGPLSHVHFSDDLFTNDPAWLAAFAPLYRRRVGVPFTCNTSAELIDEGVAASLAEAGCYAIGFAVETASAHLRLKVLRKGVTQDHLHRAAKALRGHGIKIATFNMLALPGETPEEGLSTAVLNAELGATFPRLNFAFPMPGTPMTGYALEQGLLPADWNERFARPDFRYTPGPQFHTPHRREFENLMVLFRAVAMNKRLAPAARRAMSARTPKPLYRLLTLQGAWNEKRNFRVPLVAGLRFFARVGRPELRSTNFPALI